MRDEASQPWVLLWRSRQRISNPAPMMRVSNVFLQKGKKNSCGENSLSTVSVFLEHFNICICLCHLLRLLNEIVVNQIIKDWLYTLLYKQFTLSLSKKTCMSFSHRKSYKPAKKTSTKKPIWEKKIQWNTSGTAAACYMKKLHQNGWELSCPGMQTFCDFLI